MALEFILIRLLFLSIGLFMKEYTWHARHTGRTPVLVLDPAPERASSASEGR